ncbi:EscU/YscU/HrcU family type III secretion system export apparatus switch protein [Candidatus Sumerlaeota bacterium]|nr:EscU/YscU/HrcU family type III secretion system export apparatus switch protein [Candidatus Sumerlaeota bacterium]
MESSQRDKRQIYAIGGDKQEPTLIASASGRLGERILELARLHGIPVASDPELAERLSRLDIQRELPEETYPLIEVILRFAERLDAGMDQ